MPKISTTHSLNDYPKLPISQYKEQLKQSENTATALILEYIYRGKTYKYSVKVTTSPCNYGGVRYWWQCPKCHKRVGVLYCAGLYACRHCIGANYETQLQQPVDRLFNRVAVIRERLGWKAGIAYGKGSRPRYIHHKTYKRLVTEHDEITQRIMENLI